MDNSGPQPFFAISSAQATLCACGSTVAPGATLASDGGVSDTVPADVVTSIPAGIFTVSRIETIYQVDSMNSRQFALGTLAVSVIGATDDRRVSGLLHERVAFSVVHHVIGTPRRITLQ